MNIKFYCLNDKRLKPSKKQNIFCYVRKNNQQLVINTLIKIEPKYWNNKLQKVKKGHTLEKQINDAISSFENAVEGLILEKTTENPFCTVNEIFHHIKTNVSRKDDNDFYTLYDQYIGTKSSLAPSSIKYIKNVRRLVYEFNPDLRIHQISADLIVKFESHLFNNTEFNSNYVSKITGHLKQYFNYLVSIKKLADLDYKNFKPKRAIEQSFYCLNEQEIDYIAEANIQKPRLAHIRDMFVFSCFTGQRHSDVSKFKTSSIEVIDGTKYWKLSQQKTGTPVTIPINKKLIDILDRYPNGFPKLSLGEFNTGLKLLALELNFREFTVQTTLVKNKLVTEQVEKYKLFSSHLGRRSFITTMLAKGIPTEVVMTISGHKTHREFKKYINFSLETLRDAIDTD